MYIYIYRERTLNPTIDITQIIHLETFQLSGDQLKKRNCKLLKTFRSSSFNKKDLMKTIRIYLTMNNIKNTF